MDASWAQPATPVSPGTVYKLKMTSELATKITVSVCLILLGMYYLVMGRKEQNIRLMLIGSALVLGALLIF